MSFFRLHIALLLLLLTAAAHLPAQTEAYPVKVNRKWGLINGQGDLVATPRYDAVTFSETDHAVAVLDGKYGLLAPNGRILIEPEYTFLRELSDKLVLLNLGADCSNGNCEGGKWGVINLETELLIAPQFDFIGPFDSLGWAHVNVGGACNYDDCKGGKWGVIDEDGNIVVQPYLEAVRWSNGKEIFLKGSEGWGLYDARGDSLVTELKYRSLKRVGANRLAMQLEEKFGVLDNRGQAIIPPQYEDIRDGNLGYLSFQEQGKYGLMDSLGRKVNAARYQHIEKGPFQWVFARNDRWALLDTLDREVIGPVLMEVGATGPDFAAVRQGTTWGVVAGNGREIVPMRFEQLTVVNDTTYMVVDRKFHKWYQHDGTIVPVLQIEEIGPFTGNVARARRKSGWGLLNIRGEWLLPPKYEFVGRFERVGRGRRANNKVDYIYFDDDGAPSNVRSFNVMKDKEEFDPKATLSPSTVGWFYSSAKSAWGLRPGGTGRVVLQPTYERIRIIPGTPLSLAWFRDEGSDLAAASLINHQTGRILTPALFRDVFDADWQDGSYARAIFSATGRYTLLTTSGDWVDLGATAFMGNWTNDVLRANVGGQIIWSPEAGIDTIGVRRERNTATGRLEDNYQYCTGGKWGFLDRNGKWLVEPQFDAALDFRSGISRVRQDGKWGAINANFDLAVPTAYDYIQYLAEVDGEILLAVGNNTGGYGFMDKQGELAIAPRFDEVGEFHEGLVRFREDGLWGFADTSGQVVIPPRYKEVGDFHEGRARFRNRRFWGFMDVQGEVILPETYLRAGDFHGGLAWIQADKFYGFIGLDGEEVIEPAFSKVGDFREGLAPARRKGQWGLIDPEGKWVLPASFYRIAPFQDHIAVVQQKADYGLVDDQGNFIVRPSYREIGDFSEGVAAVRAGMEFGYVDKEGERVIPCQFPRAEAFQCGRAAVFLNGKWGFIDRKAAMVIENRFSRVRGFQEDRAAVRTRGKWGFVAPDGQVVVPTIYDAVGDFSRGRAAVFVDGRGWGFVNKDGTVVIPIRYEAVGSFFNDVVAVRQKGKWGLLNAYGASMTLLKYDEIGTYREGLAPVLVRRKMGLVNSEGKKLLPAEYDVLRMERGVVQVETEDKIGYLKAQGQWIWSPQK